MIKNVSEMKIEEVNRSDEIERENFKEIEKRMSDKSREQEKIDQN